MKENQDTDIAQTIGLEPSGRAKRRGRRLLILFLVLLCAGAITLVWRKRLADANTPRYQTQPAERGNLVISVSATGTLQPTNQVEVGSELSGIIETVEVDYNARVEVGQVLARLDPQKLQAQVLRSKAALESAQANVLQARANVLETESTLKRMREVWEKTDQRAPSQNDLDIAEAAFKRAQAVKEMANAAVAEARATLDVNQTDLEKLVIRSPIDGIVLSREVDPGQTVAASLQAPKLFVLAEDLTKMELHVDVDEADVGQVKEGQEAVFTVDAYPEDTFEAKVTQVRYGSKTVSGVVTYETVLTVDNSDLLLRPGMTATADITVKNVTDAVLVPNAALRFSPPAEEKAGEGEDRSFASRLIPRRRRRSGEQEQKKSNGNQRIVWTLQDGAPVSVTISVGSTDGLLTEVLGGDVEAGQPLLIGIEEENDV